MIVQHGIADVTASGRVYGKHPGISPDASATDKQRGLVCVGSHALKQGILLSSLRARVARVARFGA